MKFKFMMKQEEKDELVRKTIQRLAKALYNACNQSYKENGCKGCKFHVGHGCALYSHPITWKDKFK